MRLPSCLKTLGNCIIGSGRTKGRCHGHGTRRPHPGTPGPGGRGAGRRDRLRRGDRLGAGAAVRREGREPVLACAELPGPQDPDRPARPGGTGRPGHRRARRTGREGRAGGAGERVPRLRPRTPRPLCGGPAEAGPRGGRGQRGRQTRADDQGDPARLRPDRAGPDPRRPAPGQRLPRLRQPGDGKPASATVPPTRRRAGTGSSTPSTPSCATGPPLRPVDHPGAAHTPHRRTVHPHRSSG